MNRSTCNTCKRLVPATRMERGGQVFLVKTCPECGPSETLISGDAARYQAKRRLDSGFEHRGCTLQCLSCTHKKPNIVFVDVTNRCNLNCPICINNTPSMGFLFEPPLDYFRRIFQHFSTYAAPPSIQLFGGEPTVREDLFDIIRLAKSFGLPTRVVTNGVKLADEDYCRKLIETRATILIAYDGANPELYRVLRKSEKVLGLKQKAIDNIQKIGHAKVTLMTLAAKGFNDGELPELFRFCHARRDCIRAIYFMPLAHTWNPETFQLQPDRITGEDIEQLIADAFSREGEASAETPVEFLPAAFMGEIPTLVHALRIRPLPFAGAHPNCESLYALVSDGEKYQPLSYYLKSPIADFANALRNVEKRLARHAPPVLSAKAASDDGKLTFREKLFKLRAILGVAGVFRRHGRLGRLFKGRGLGKVYHAAATVFGFALGRRTRTVLERHANAQGFLQIITLPFEDRFTLETDRLERCPSAFAFWDPAEDRVKHVPVCAWGIHKTAVMRQIMDHYEHKPATVVPAVAAPAAT